MEINALLQALQSVTEAKNILTGEDIGADFTHDEYPGESYAPDAVVRAVLPIVMEEMPLPTA